MHRVTSLIGFFIFLVIPIPIVFFFAPNIATLFVIILFPVSIFIRFLTLSFLSFL
jgi:hypothetical protein